MTVTTRSLRHKTPCEQVKQGQICKNTQSRSILTGVISIGEMASFMKTKKEILNYQRNQWLLAKMLPYFGSTIS